MPIAVELQLIKGKMRASLTKGHRFENLLRNLNLISGNVKTSGLGLNCRYRLLFTVYCQVIWLRRIWVGHIARMGEIGNAYKILVGKSQGKYHLRALGIY
jgi:hypothetical protein